jgi:SAM-dependent methyltransferase
LSLERLRDHRRIWMEKPVLAQVYRPWFGALLDLVPERGRALEVGAGPGFLGEHAALRRPDVRLTTTDILQAPWNNVVADALQLPLRSGSFDTVLGVDFVHHLARPAAFFAEVARVLEPGGRLAVVEPWVTPLSFPVYRWLHQEGCRPRLDPWDPFRVGLGKKDAFDGDAAVVWALVKRTPAERWRDLGFVNPRVRVLNGFAYLLSLGFKPGSLLPLRLTSSMQAVDRALDFAAPLFGMRALAVWRKTGSGFR